MEEPCHPRCQTDAIDCLGAQRTSEDLILKLRQPPCSNSELPCLLCGNPSQRLTAVSSFSFIFLTYINGLRVSGGPDGKESTCNARDLGSIPGLGRSPGEGNSNPFQYSCLENSIDRGVWQARSMGSKRIGHDWATTATSKSMDYRVHSLYCTFYGFWWMCNDMYPT